MKKMMIYLKLLNYFIMKIKILYFLNIKYKMEKHIISQAQANELYKTLKFIHDAFTKAKINYFMVGGTLLGAVRHQGIIQIDDDGDLCIFKEDVPKLRKLIPYFDKNGYDLEEGTEAEEGEDEKECLNRKNSCTWFVSCRRKNCLGVDIFVMYTKGNKITYYDPYWETAPNGGKKCYFSLELMFPLLPYRFGNYFLMGPHNALEHLNRCYGGNWNEKWRVLFDHRSGEWKNTKPVKLKPEEFLTFKAPKSTCDTKIPKIACYDKREKYFSPKKSVRKSTKKSRRKSPKKSSKKIIRK